MELEELHVLERQAATVGQRHAVAGERVRVGRRLEDLARATGGEDDRLRLEDVDLAGREVVGDDAGRGDRLVVGDLARGEVMVGDEVEDVELVEELDVLLDALLVERLEDHVPGAVRGVARAAHRGLAVVAGVPAEPALVDAALGRAVERQAHALEVEHRVDGLLGHDLRGVLVDEVVAALDRVERVPLPVVLLHVRERGAHAALRGARVRARGVELGDDGRPDLAGRLQRRAHPGAACADDDDVVLMGLHRGRCLLGESRVEREEDGGVRWCGAQAVQNDASSSAGAFAGQGSNVKITSVPRTVTIVKARYSASLRTRRVPSAPRSR